MVRGPASLRTAVDDRREPEDRGTGDSRGAGQSIFSPDSVRVKCSDRPTFLSPKQHLSVHHLLTAESLTDQEALCELTCHRSTDHRKKEKRVFQNMWTNEEKAE
ncbi:hypothetical protein AOLI_G00106900 [Acnodon oligacanthus]